MDSGVLTQNIPSGVSTNAFSGIDIVVVVDQPGSMSVVHDGGLLPNDPDGRRCDAVWALAGRLITDVKNSDRLHRISIVEFGDSVNVPISALKIAYDKDDPDGHTILNHIDSRFRTKNMKNTDHLLALETASKEINKMNQDKSVPAGYRKSYILLITDGKSDVRRAPYWNQTGFNAVLYKKDLRNKVSRLFPTGAFWIAALNDKHAQSYWNAGWGDLWSELCGDSKTIGVYKGRKRAQLIEDQSEIRDYIREIIAFWLGAPVPKTKIDEYVCPPYLKAVLFDLELENPSDVQKVHILDPDGQPIPESKFVTALGGRSIKITIDKPKPGIWKLKQPGATGYKVSVEPLYNEILLLHPASECAVNVPIDFRFRITDEYGKLFTFNPDYPVKGKLEVITPNGGEVNIPMEMKSNGEFTSTRQYTPTLKGKYDLIFGGTVIMKNLKGKSFEVEVYQSRIPRIHSMNVTNKTALILKLEKPCAGDKIGLFLGKGTIVVHGRFIRADEPSVPISPDDIATNVDQLFGAKIINIDSQVIYPTQPIVVEKDYFKARFHIWFKPFSRKWFGINNKVALLFELDDNVLKKDYFFQEVQQKNPNNLPRSFDPFSTAWMPVRETLWSLILLFFMSLVVILSLFVLLLKVFDYNQLQRIDKRLQPVLIFDNFFHPDQPTYFPIMGKRRVVFKNIQVQLPVSEKEIGTVWNLRYLKVQRQRSDKYYILVKITYLPYNKTKKTEMETFELISREGEFKVLEEFPDSQYHFRLSVRENSFTI